MSRKKVETVREDLPTINETRWTNDYRLLVLPIKNRAGTNGGIGVALANLVAFLTEENALLLANDLGPVPTLLVSCVTKKFHNSAHRSDEHLSRASSR